MINAAHGHLLLNHFPIIGAMLGLVLWGIALRLDQKTLYRMALSWWVAMAALTIPVFLSGNAAEHLLEPLMDVSRSLQNAEDLMEAHEAWGRNTLIAAIALGVTGIVGLMRLKTFERLSNAFKALALAVALAFVGIAAYTGHLGGLIRHEEIRPGFIAPHANDD